MKTSFAIALQLFLLNILYSQPLPLPEITTSTEIDTIWYRKNFNFNTETGFTGQEALIQWFEAPAEMKLKVFGFHCSKNDNLVAVEFLILKLNYSKVEIDSLKEKSLGYYPSLVNEWRNSITEFKEYATGIWFSTSEGTKDPIKEIIWTFYESIIWPVPEVISHDSGYIGFDLELSDKLPVANKGDLIGVYLRNGGMSLTGDSISFYSSENTGYNCLKFFRNNRFPGDNNSKGWWILNQTLDFIFIGERISTNIESDGNSLTDYFLFQNYPNPFNAETIISWQAPKSENVTIKLYDVLGNEILNLFTGGGATGINRISFNAANLASGIYYYKIQSDYFYQTKKLMILK